VLYQINRGESKPPVIMVTGQGDEAVAVEAMKNGAQDYIIKMRNYHEALPVAIERVIRQSRMKRELEEASLRGRLLYELSFSVAKERKVDALSRRLVEGVTQLIGVEQSILYLVNEDDAVVFVASHGVDIDRQRFMGPVRNIGMLAAAYSAKQPVVMEELRLHPQWVATPWLHARARHVLCVPLTMQGRVEGALCLINKLDSRAFTHEEINTVSTLAVHVGVAIDNARFLERKEQEAVTDSLTGLYNHMEFQKQLAEELERSHRYANEFSLLMLDLDHFKMVNDTYGHQVGDSILKKMAHDLRSQLRSIDKVFRYGGEEFAVILPETGEKGAKVISEEIHRRIAANSYGMATDRSLKITVSIGVSSFPQDAEHREELVGTADQALFSAKRAGRNRVVMYSEALGALADGGSIPLDGMLRDPHLNMLRDLAAVIDAKSPYTKGHTEAVSEYAMRFAEALNLGEQDKTNLRYASLLHNIGIVGIPTKLLDKQGPLTPEGRKIVNTHPSLAQMLIRQTEQLTAVLPTILYHHERYDGHGYPNGLKGEEIPYLARVLSVIDAYNAMISARAYRPKLSEQQAIEELRRHAGTQFDPGITAAFIAFLQQGDSMLSDIA
jgi:diguanylate cyclase (GGDEF)-like protein